MGILATFTTSEAGKEKKPAAGTPYEGGTFNGVKIGAWKSHKNGRVYVSIGRRGLFDLVTADAILAKGAAEVAAQAVKAALADGKAE